MDVFQYVLSDLWGALGISENGFIQMVISLVLRLLLAVNFYVEIQRTLPFLVLALAIPAQVAIKSINILLSHAKQIL